MASWEGNHPGTLFQAESSSLIRFMYLAADADQPNELWFIGSARELQEELELAHYTEVCFNVGDEIKFRQSIMKVIATEASLLPSCPLSHAEQVITYYIAARVFPLM